MQARRHILFISRENHGLSVTHRHNECLQKHCKQLYYYRLYLTAVSFMLNTLEGHKVTIIEVHVTACYLTKHKKRFKPTGGCLHYITCRFEHSTPWLLPTARQLARHTLRANEGKQGRVATGAKGEIMFRLFRVSVSIFLGLTDRPINLIYRVSPHPLTSSTGLLSNNELLGLGTIGVLVATLSCSNY